MAGNSLGSAGVQLFADTAQYQADMGKAAAVAEREMRRIQRESQMAAAIVNELGKRMQLAANTTEQSWSRQASAASKARQEVAQTAKEQHMARVQAQQLGYQMTDIITGLATGQRPLTVLLQQGGQLRDLYGSVGGAVAAFGRGLLSMVSPATLFATAIGAVVYEMVQGAKESEEFQRQIALTGNFAAASEKQVMALAEANARITGKGINASRDSVMALLGTGTFGADSLKVASQAMAEYQRLTGQTADEAVKNFESISQGAAKWALEQTRHLHFLTSEQYVHIKALEDEGKQMDAVRETLRIYDSELQTRHGPAIGTIARDWNFWAAAIDRVKRAIMDWGKPDSLDDQIAAARKRVETLQSSYDEAARNGRLKGLIAERANDLAKARAELEQLEARASLQSAGDAARAEMARREQQKIDSIVNAQGKVDQYKKLTEEIKLYNDETQRMADTGQKVADYDHWAAEQKAKLTDQTLKLTEAQKKSLAASIDEAAQRRKAAEFANSPDYLGQVDDELKRRKEEQAIRDADALDRLSYSSGINKGAENWWKDAIDQQKAGEHLITGSLQRLEDAFMDFARTGKLSLKGLFEFMAEEWIRTQIRMAMSKFFYSSAGAFGGEGSGLAGIIGWLGSFADGNAYVAHDGPAYLHEGERVLTRQQNAAFTAGGGGSGGMTINLGGNTYVTGDGVNQAQVMATVQAGNRQLEARIRRLISEGSFAT